MFNEMKMNYCEGNFKALNKEKNSISSYHFQLPFMPLRNISRILYHLLIILALKFKFSNITIKKCHLPFKCPVYI